MKIQEIKKIYLNAVEKLKESFEFQKNQIEKGYKDTKKELDEEYKKALENIKEDQHNYRKKIWKNWKNSCNSEISFFLKIFSCSFFVLVFFDFLLRKIDFIDVVLVSYNNILVFFLSGEILSKFFLLLIIFICIYFIFSFGRFLFLAWNTNKIRIFNVVFISILYFLILFGFSLLSIVIICMVVFLLLGVQIYINEYEEIKKENNKKGILLSDEKIKNKNDDVFWDENRRYQKFYELIKNNSSTDNQVFGLIAEWGTGKSSFLHLLKDEVRDKDNVIFVDFNPWYYESQKELLEKLFDEIVAALRENNKYTGDISRKFSKFVNMLEENSSGIFGMKIPFYSMFFGGNSLEEQKNKINNFLSKIGKKIVIIIDDLDRVTRDKFIEVLKIVDLTRDFYNTSFILCYDPQNFNSVDTTLIQTERSNSEGFQHLDSQRIDNSELTRYMAKIININTSIFISTKFLIIEFNKYIADFQNDFFTFGKYSKGSIKNSIDKLFEFDNFILWGKYLKNLREIKRGVNLVVSTIILSKGDNNEVEYFDENFGIKFDIFMKLCVLQINFFHLYKDIENEVTISESYYGSDSKYILKGFSDKQENPKFERYISSLKEDEKKIILNLFPFYNKNGAGFNDREKFQLRDFQNLKPYIDLFTGNFSEIEKDIVENRSVLSIIHEYIKGDKNADEVINSIFDSNNFSVVNNFLRKFPDELIKEPDGDSKKELSFNIIESIISFERFYKFYDNDFTFYLDIAQVLNASMRQNDKIVPTHISDYVYGEGKYQKALPIKIFENGKTFGEEEEIKGLVEGLRTLLAADTTRGGGFYNFDRAVKTDELYKIIYPYFEENYKIPEKNFIEFIYEFEEKYERKILGHLLYMLLNYAPDEKKKSLTKYFIEGFKISEENYFKWIIRHIDDFHTDRPILRISEIAEYFDKELFEQYIQDNHKNIINWLKENSNKQIEVESKYGGHPKMKFSYKDIMEMYIAAYEREFNSENK